MKSQLIAIVAAVLVVGCGPSAYQLNERALLEAAVDGNIEAVKQHLAAGTDVNAMEEAFTLAAEYGHKEIVELLIAKGADVNAKDEDLWTPLHFATGAGRKEVAELLIDKGADVNARNNVGASPLALANGETAELLRKHGGKTGIQRQGRSEHGRFYQ